MPDQGELSPLTTAAVALHEMYISLMEGGFTRSEAIEIVAVAITRGQPTDGE